MSASPAGLPNGQQSGPPKGPPLPRRKPRADPLVARKKPKPKPVALAAPIANGEAKKSGPAYSNPLATQGAEQRFLEFDRARKLNGGWTDPKPPPDAQVRDIPLILTKRSLREDRRFHIMRLQRAAKGARNEQDIDPTNQDDFTRPVSLHRRDPRQPPPGRVTKEDPPTPPTVDEKEDQRLAQQKAEREAQRAIDLAQIAPTAKEAALAKRSNQKKEKAFQVNRGKRTDAQKKEAELHYEEALPWHLEDVDGKNVWVGSYISALSEANVGLVVDGNRFRMIPLEKYYRFTPKPPFQSYSVEEAEAIMKKGVPVGRWAKRDLEKRAAEQEEQDYFRWRGGGQRFVKQESNTYLSAPRSERVEHDDVDMEGDEFQDDDEQVGFEADNDDESKDARDRTRRDQLGANLFGDANEQQVEKEEAEALMAELRRKLDGKKLRKALTRREGHKEYQDLGSDDDDFLESSSEEEEEKKEDANQPKKEEEVNAANAKVKAEPKDKVASGAASRGNTTPSGKPKPADIAKKTKSLKRPGSPNLSESSGNESSHKRVKKQPAGPSSLKGSRATTPMPGQQKAKGKGGAASDGEATAGEMSDGARARKQKIKLVGTGARGTPAGSRAGSPAPAPGLTASTGAPANRAGSSTSRVGSPSGAQGPPYAPIETAEIINILRTVPDPGITIGMLLRRFGSRVGEGPGQMARKEWVQLVKKVAFIEDEATKVLRLKTGA